MTSFIKRIIKKPPVLFPWVALFHLFCLLYSVWNYRTEPFPSVAWMQPLWMLGYTAAWIFVCDMKRWAAYAYIGLTTLNLVLHFALKTQTDLNNYADTLFPVDILFSFILLFFFRKFE